MHHQPNEPFKNFLLVYSSRKLDKRLVSSIGYFTTASIEREQAPNETILKIEYWI